MSNVEGMYSIFFIKEMERHAAQAPALRERFHPSIFCGSLFNPGHRGGQSNHQKTMPFWCSFTRAHKKITMMNPP